MANKAKIKYLEYRDFKHSLNTLYRQGGEPKRKADAVWDILNKIRDGHDDPFADIKETNFGESRIKHAVKYDMNDGYRLITIKDKKQVLFCFVGNHDNSQKWLDRNKGFTRVAIPDGHFYQIDTVITEYDFEDSAMPKSDDRFCDKLTKEHNKLLINIAKDIYAEINTLTFSTNSKRIKDICREIENSADANNVSSILCAMKNGDMENAVKQLNLLGKKIKEIELLDDAEILNIQDGEQIKEIKIGSPEYSERVKRIIESPNYQDWMLFMHPEQQKIVDKDFFGSALLSGVSGSGKTCIVVQRAIRLAMTTSSKVLVLTLNPGLARLISEILDYSSGDANIRSLVEVKSFFDLCKKLLIEYQPQNEKLFNQQTWKTDEHVDEIWREFYRCQANNDDAKVLFALHKSLFARKIDAETYIRQEFDWIRSLSLPRDEYLTIDRIGRAHGIEKNGDDRRNMLKGLCAWEEKLWAIGVSDYLNLSTILYKYID